MKQESHSLKLSNHFDPIFWKDYHSTHYTAFVKLRLHVEQSNNYRMDTQ
jgi:hypothetical protein